MEIPVCEDKIYDVEVVDINHRGQGVTKIDGLAVFINGGLPGDKAKIKIDKVKKRYAIADILSIQNPSPNRISPECKVSNLCGGCQMQAFDYKAQLDIKTNRVKNEISRIGGIDNIIIHPTIGMNYPFRYRNKAQFPVRMVKGKTMIGFYKRGTHEVVDISSCNIQHEVNDKILDSIKEYINKYDIKPYNEKTGKGILRHVLTKTSFKTKDLMIVIITNGQNLPHKKELIHLLKDSLPNLKSIIQNINTRKTNVILGNKSIVLYGENKITDWIGDLKFNISAESFFQVNPIQTEVLYEKALEYADLKGDETAFDLYCGIGTISLFLAQKAKKVYGIEIVEKAIKDAKENAAINEIDNVSFYAGKAEKIFPRLYNQGIKADVVVVDPPRKGCDKSVLETIVSMNPKKVVYVSCNPATLARDLKYLNENGYKALEIQPVDMFPHTMHVETVVLIEKK